MSFTARVGSYLAKSFRLFVGAAGPWYADCTFDSDAPTVSERVTIEVGGVRLIGTVAHQGVFAGTKTARIVAGGGGWGSVLPPKGYHNDAGVKALNVAHDAAREAGETMGGFAPELARLGVDYARQRGFASRALEDVIGSAAWWVDYAGVTQVGARSSAEVSPEAYEVLEADPRSRRVALGVQDLSSVVIGSVLSKGLDGPHTVRDLEIELEAERIRVVAWCGAETDSARLAGLLQSIIERSTGKPLHGLYEYRVIRMSVDRVELQAVDKTDGLPDLLPVSMRPGVAGVHADLAPGAVVIVQFVGGRRTRPIVTHFEGADGAGFLPAALTLGGTSGAPVARQGDAVEVLLPPAVFSGSIGGVPSTGVLTFPMVKTLGTITGGSGKVGCA